MMARGEDIVEHVFPTKISRREEQAARVLEDYDMLEEAKTLRQRCGKTTKAFGKGDYKYDG